MDILIINNETEYVLPVNKNILEKIVYFLTKDLTLPSEVSLIVIEPKEMKRLYKDYKGIEKATDVLSFPAEWKELSKVLKYNMLGDIYINWKKIVEQAKEFGHSEKREFCYLFAHGVLHLLGYNHIEASEEKKMNELTEKAMKNIGVTRYERSI